MAESLDRISVRGADIVDSLGRHVVLRGLVTITSFSDRLQLERDAGDYLRMARDWGMNVQVIRLEAGSLGASPECRFQPTYLDKISRWTNAAAAAGVYTMFKMTTYDAPSWGVGSAFSNKRWQQFWNNVDGQQDVHIAGWRRVWERFSDNPAVIGYDILNEPHEGTDTPHFHRDFLFAYYQKAARALREIDPHPALVFQPAPQSAATEDLALIEDPHPLFAPHFYPRTQALYARYESRHLEMAHQFNYAMVYGEYGLPDSEFRNPVNRDQVILPGWTAEDEQLAAAVFDRNGLGAVRPWYVHSPFWSVVHADGSEHEKMNILARPYPRRASNAQGGWSFDFESKCFTLPLGESVSSGSNVVYVPRRHFPGGFNVSMGTEKYSFTAGGDAVVSHGTASFDPKSDLLTLSVQAQPVVVTIEPREGNEPG